MHRKLVLLLLMVAAFWQVLAVGGQAGAFSDSKAVAHAMLHWEGRAHHHHHDGSVTQDDSSESVQHVVADGCLSTIAVWSSAGVVLPLAEADRLVVADELSTPSPDLSGPRRPPRSTA